MVYIYFFFINDPDKIIVLRILSAAKFDDFICETFLYTFKTCYVALTQVQNIATHRQGAHVK
jgi:hypothetical protein